MPGRDEHGLVCPALDLDVRCRDMRDPWGEAPGAGSANFSAADLLPLSDETMSKVLSIYDRSISDMVHHYW